MNISNIIGDRRYGLSFPSTDTIKAQWFSNVRGDLLAGIVVALALIPEAIAFSIIAGVDPKVGLYASFCIAAVTAFIGGRPGMISAATGAMALVMITLVRDHGLEYLFAATILTGVLQILFGWFKLGRYMKFVPKPVMVGFVNALAILIFMAQLPLFIGAGWMMYAIVAGGLAIIYLLPRLTTAIPSPLVAIVALTLVSLLTAGGLSRVGDMGALPSTLPFFSLPTVPFSLETLQIIFPVAVALSLVGLIESLLTASIVDEMTDTPSDKNKEARGQGMFWCTADVGWVTGHSYIVYGPLVNGATQVFFEGTPTYPDASRFWDVVDKHEVTQFYTAPTAIRALMAQGDDFVTKTDRSSIKLLGTVGEPINPEAWRWYHEVVGEGRCPIIDTWWQTETGGIMITPIPGAMPQKPGSAAMPFFGIQPQVLDADGNVQEGAAEGLLVLADSWPSQMRTVYKNHDRFVKTYFSQYEGKYFTGDGCRRDADGYYWITGRVDDVLNVSGHRIGTAEVESALVLHDDVAEAAVVGYPHNIKGQGIYAYVTLMAGVEPSDELRQALAQHVRDALGAIARPEHIQFAPFLPKTRSSKIMRRILRKIAANDYDDLGDTSTLADPSVVEDLIENRRNR